MSKETSKIARSSSLETLSFSEDLFKLIHCCIRDEIHYAQDALILPCKHHVCKGCVEKAYRKEVKCGFENCTGKYVVENVALLTPNPMVELVIQQYQSELTSMMKEDLAKKVEYIKEKSLSQRVDENFELVYLQIDERYNSLKGQLEASRDTLHKALETLKTDFEVIISTGNNLSVDHFYDEFKSKTSEIGFHEYEKAYIDCKKKLNSILHLTPKISFEQNEFQFDETKLGEVVNLFPYVQTDFEESAEFEFKHVSRMIYLEQSKEIILVDYQKKCLIKYTDEGKFKQKTKLKQILDSPHAICVNEKDEIFVGDRNSRKVFVFNPNLTLIRKFGTKNKLFPTDMAIDKDTGRLYATNWHQNRISAWNSENGEYVNEFEIDSPYHVRVNEKYLIVVSNADFTTDSGTRLVEKLVKGSNCIFLLDKVYLSIERVIKMDNWLDPRSLYIDRNANIVTTAFTVDNEQYASSCRNFYVFDFDGNCLLKRETNLNSIVDLLIINRKRFFVIEATNQKATAQ